MNLSLTFATLFGRLSRRYNLQLFYGNEVNPLYSAIDEFGYDIHADEARKNEQYYCPFCHAPMILKAGRYVVRHFAHLSSADCDPWYSGRMSKWHKDHQALFPENCREVKICDDENPSIYHIADIFIEREEDSNIIVEFQNSSITTLQFEERTSFYMNNRKNYIDGEAVKNIVVWVFNYTDKKVFVSESFEESYIVNCTWPGNDRVRFLDDHCGGYYVYIIFQVTKCKYEIHKREYVGYDEYEKYELVESDPDKAPIYVHVFKEEDNYHTFNSIRIPLNAIERYITYAPDTYLEAYSYFKDSIPDDDDYI